MANSPDFHSGECGIVTRPACQIYSYERSVMVTQQSPKLSLSEMGIAGSNPAVRAKKDV